MPSLPIPPRAARTLVACIVITAAACGGGVAVAPVEAPPLVAPQDPQPPTLAEGTIAVEVACAADAVEACNAVDDDCDGEIDEGCGYQAGEIQVTATWSGDADLDLVITDAEDTSIDLGSSSAGGGRIDQDGRGACEPGPLARLANAHWVNASPGSSYRVALRHVSGCVEDAASETASVTISVRGTVFGPFNRAVEPGEEATVLVFQAP